MLNEVDIAALETVAKLAGEEEQRAGAEKRYGDADRALMVGEWCLGELTKAKMDAAPPLLDRDEREMLATWNKVLP